MNLPDNKYTNKIVLHISNISYPYYLLHQNLGYSFINNLFVEISRPFKQILVILVILFIVYVIKTFHNIINNYLSKKIPYIDKI